MSGSSVIGGSSGDPGCATATTGARARSQAAPLTRTALVLKDSCERVLAALLLVAALPLLVVVGLGIRATSPGGVIFKQVRAGQGGRPFVMWKLRTMRMSAEAELPAVRHLGNLDHVLFKLPHDPRRTRLGRWLRRFSIDELPQLWNVLKGEMSLVGPRPALPSEVARYDADALRRLAVKPGMTGLWQVSGRSDLPWDHGIRLDLQYVETWSLALDLLILWKTLGAVLRGRGAY